MRVKPALTADQARFNIVKSAITSANIVRFEKFKVAMKESESDLRWLGTLYQRYFLDL